MMGRLKTFVCIGIFVMAYAVALAGDPIAPELPLGLFPEAEPSSPSYYRYQSLELSLDPPRNGQKNLVATGQYWQIRSSHKVENKIIRDYFEAMALSNGEILNNSYSNDLTFIYNLPQGPLYVDLHIQSTNYNLKMVMIDECPEKIVFGDGYYATVKREKEKSKPTPPLITDFPDSYFNSVTYNDFNTMEFSYKAEGKTIKKKAEGRYWNKTVYLNDRSDRSAKWVAPEEVTETWRQAVLAAGGKILNPGERGVDFHLFSPEAGDIWASIWPQSGRYTLKMIQEQSMEQVLVFDTDSMMARLDALGVLTLDGIYFDSAKATLKQESEEALTAAQKLMTDYQDLVLEVGGHTDNIGSAQSNEDLSQRRAASVSNWLIDHGITPGRLQAKGYGEASFIADNETEEGRAANRRVELKKISGGKVRDVMSLIKPYPGSTPKGHDEKSTSYELELFERNSSGTLIEFTVVGSGFRQYFQVLDENGQRNEQLSGVQIRHNYIQAVEEFGGTILAENSHGLYFRLDNLDGSQTFVALWAPSANYQITAVTVTP